MRGNTAFLHQVQVCAFPLDSTRHKVSDTQRQKSDATIAIALQYNNGSARDIASNKLRESWRVEVRLHCTSPVGEGFGRHFASALRLLPPRSRTVAAHAQLSVRITVKPPVLCERRQAPSQKLPPLDAQSDAGQKCASLLLLLDAKCGCAELQATR